ncbi:hypothetical protein E3Q17_00331 [Wallemia mellicola]|uniref:SP-RING-type domain-containing protein n=1 Tax=Wallemia mellicola TaxID=1708541 RepID=A0A4T0P5Q9_9BASI|nr:hypothetical protein E3Q17_00331 [Wallemia mellicola]TIC14198.1 hypothetical protein E3Q14_00879 [Wallemia mellicola]
MSVEYDKDADIGRNDRNSIRSLNSLWKRVPIDAASENVVDLITQIQYCKRYDPNGGWEHLETTADNNMRFLVDLENRLQMKQETANEIVNEIENDAKIVKPANVFQQKFDSRQAQYDNKTARQKYSNNSKIQSYYNAIWAVSKPDEVVPNIKKLIPREDDDSDDDDSDIEIGSMRQNFNDPITLGLFQNPYTSTKCNHSYSFESIKAYLNGSTKLCPYSGCRSSIAMRDLKEDHRLAKRVQQIASRDAEEEHYHQIDAEDN